MNYYLAFPLLRTTTFYRIARLTTNNILTTLLSLIVNISE